jgi:hypothetical protein
MIPTQPIYRTCWKRPTNIRRHPSATKRAAAPDFFKATSKRNVQAAHNDPAEVCVAGKRGPSSAPLTEDFSLTLMAAAAAGCYEPKV